MLTCVFISLGVVFYLGYLRLPGLCFLTFIVSTVVWIILQYLAIAFDAYKFNSYRSIQILETNIYAKLNIDLFAHCCELIVFENVYNMLKNLYRSKFLNLLLFFIALLNILVAAVLLIFNILTIKKCTVNEYLCSFAEKRFNRVRNWKIEIHEKTLYLNGKTYCPPSLKNKLVEYYTLIRDENLDHNVQVWKGMLEVVFEHSKHKNLIISNSNNGVLSKQTHFTKHFVPNQTPGTDVAHFTKNYMDKRSNFITVLTTSNCYKPNGHALDQWTGDFIDNALKQECRTEPIGGMRLDNAKDPCTHLLKNVNLTEHVPLQEKLVYEVNAEGLLFFAHDQMDFNKDRIEFINNQVDELHYEIQKMYPGVKIPDRVLIGFTSGALDVKDFSTVDTRSLLYEHVFSFIDP